mmetsp:Transcript_15583/g.31524  ORF Transcript_15583/g.31524 Transcript_15583/m.31524 type:complete len:110 (-) Transcript_15583:218-547(-)
MRLQMRSNAYSCRLELAAVQSQNALSTAMRAAQYIFPSFSIKSKFEDIYDIHPLADILPHADALAGNELSASGTLAASHLSRVAHGGGLAGRCHDPSHGNRGGTSQYLR